MFAGIEAGWLSRLPPVLDCGLGYGDGVEGLKHIAESVWGLSVNRALPVTESFSSDVLLFEASDGSSYVIKKPFSPAKGQREVDALTALAPLGQVATLIDHRLISDDMYLLIEGLDGTSWTTIEGTSRQFLHTVGAAARGVHETRYGSFDVCDTWHDLLRYNADRYHGTIGDPDRELAGKARAMFERYLVEVPNSTEPVLVQFDMRPGNILTKNGEFVALIDFESARGGHPSMDFFKFWQQVEPLVPGAMDALLAGYQQADPAHAPDSHAPADWMSTSRLDRLMKIYSIYHGLAGLSWCHQRDDFSGNFPYINRGLIAAALGAV